MLSGVLLLPGTYGEPCPGVGRIPPPHKYLITKEPEVQTNPNHRLLCTSSLVEILLICGIMLNINIKCTLTCARKLSQDFSWLFLFYSSISSFTLDKYSKRFSPEAFLFSSFFISLSLIPDTISIINFEKS